MPAIPRGQFTTNLRTAGARIDPGAATAVTRAVGQIGQTLTGQAALAQRQQKQADDAAFVAEKTNAMLRQETEIFADIETRGASVDLGTQQEQFNNRLSVLLEDSPSEDATREIRMQADNAFSRKFFPAYSKHQAGINVRKRINSFESALDDIQSEVLTGRTDVPEAVARASATIEGLRAVAGGVVDADKMKRNAFNTISTNSMTGRIKKGEGQAVIDEINKGRWDALTDTGTLARVLSLAERDVKQRASAEKRQYGEGLNDYNAFLASGQDDEDTAERFSPDQVNARFEPEEAAKINEQIADSRSFGITMNEIKTATQGELAEIIERETPSGPEKFARESKQLNILESAIRQRNKMISDDPALYALNNSQISQDSFDDYQQARQSGDPEVIAESAREYAAIQRSFQEDIGVHPDGVQFLPKQFEEQLAQELNDFSQGGENVALRINELKESFGPEWPAVQRQLQQNKQMGTGLRVISGMDFGPAMIRTAEAMAIPQLEYKKVIGNDDFNDIKADVRGELDDFWSTMSAQPGAEDSFNDHQEAIQSLAMKYMADGKFTSTRKAIDQAIDDVLNDRFTFVDSMRIPVEQNPIHIETGVNNLIESVKAGDFNLLIPDDENVRNLEDRTSVYLSVLRPVPITEPNGTGILLTTENNHAILKEDGTPLIFTWKEITEQRRRFDITASFGAIR